VLGDLGEKQGGSTMRFEGRCGEVIGGQSGGGGVVRENEKGERSVK